MAQERTKLTVTIPKNLFGQIDDVIDGKRIRNRSQATEYLIAKGLGLHRITTAFVLAGGKGSGLRPFTYEVPAPLLPVRNRPILAHTLTHLAHHGVQTAYLAVGYKKELIKEALGDGRQFGLKIRYLEEPRPLGTAGPLRAARRYLTESFFLIWGDILFDFDLFDLARFHKESGGTATLALTTLAAPARVGVVGLRGHHIESFVEKPRPGATASTLVNTGVAVCNPEIVALIPPGKSSLERGVYPKLAAAGSLVGYVTTGRWLEMTNQQQYETAVKGWN